MMALLSPWLWRAVAVAAVLAGLTWGYHLWSERQRETGRNEIRAEWQADKLARAEQNRILLMANAKTSSDLQAAADKERKAYHAQIRSIDLERDELIRRLRSRPERPKPAPGGDRVPEVAGPAGPGPGNTGCTGDRLYRDDSEALVRLGAAGDRLRFALKQCRVQYHRSQAAQNSVTPSSD